MKYDVKELESKMKKTIAAYEANLAVIRVGQANASVLNRVTFEYYGEQTLLNTMADIRVTDPRTLTIAPYDRSTLKAMEKAILMSDVGITPSNDGTTIRLVFPQLDGERRKEVTKQVQKMGEETKVALRNIRRTANDDIKKAKKDGTMTEDEVTASEKTVQDITDKYIKNVDVITAAKTKEVTTL